MSNMINSDDLRNSLIRYWGYNDFRDSQLEICEKILGGQDVFAMVTSKSIFYSNLYDFSKFN